MVPPSYGLRGLIIAKSLHPASGIPEIRNQLSTNATSIDYAARRWQVFRALIAGALDELKALLGEMVTQVMETADTVEKFGERFARYGFPASAMTPMFGLAENAFALTLPPHRPWFTHRSDQGMSLRVRGAPYPPSIGITPYGLSPWGKL